VCASCDKNSTVCGRHVVHAVPAVAALVGGLKVAAMMCLTSHTNTCRISPTLTCRV